MSADLLASHLLLVCCNGGIPFVDLDIGFGLGPAIGGYDLTDWVATDQPLGNFVNQDYEEDNETLTDNQTSPWLHNLDTRLPIVTRIVHPLACDLYNLSFTTPHLTQMFNDNHGLLTCRCPTMTMGQACEIVASALTLTSSSETQTGWPSRMYFLLLPILFIVFALVGAFAIKFFLHDLPVMRQLCCVGKYDEEEEEEHQRRHQQRHPVPRNENDFAVDMNYEATRNPNYKNGSLSDPLPQETVNSLLKRAEQSSYGAPSLRGQPAERVAFLPTVTQQCQPIDYPVYNATTTSAATAANQQRQQQPNQQRQQQPNQQRQQPPTQQRRCQQEPSPPPSYRSVDGQRTPTERRTFNY